MINLQQRNGTIIKIKDNVNYWWVNQGATFDYESSSKLIQCRPDDNLRHHLFLCETRLDDIIIHYAKGKIKAISVITKECFYISDGNDHRRNNCEYYLLRNQIDRETARNILEIGLGDFPKPPFRENGWVELGYLYPFPVKGFNFLFPQPIQIF